MAGLAAALVNLALIQVAATVTVDSVVYSIDEVFDALPNWLENPTTPFIANTWTFPEQDDVLAQEVHRYQINSQWFIHEEDSDSGTLMGEVSLAMWEHWLNLWQADQRFKNGGAATVISSIMVGAPARLEFNGRGYIGLDIIISVQIERDANA